MPTAVKVWLVGFLPIWIAAKIHTWTTIGSGNYVARHWPFWAALVASTLAVKIGAAVHDRLPERRVSHPSN